MGEEGLFRRVQEGRGRRGGHTVRLISRALDCYYYHDHEMTLSLLCFLLDPLTNKYCRTWRSMINLWIDPGPVKSKESCSQQGKVLTIT